MKILIEYNAKLSWTENERNERFQEYHDGEMCAIKHEIDSETLQTISFTYTPIDKIKYGM